MIKFFRKIRQKLLTENKFSKYLIYAIGEIILVTIGILIALAINEQNNSKNNNKLRDLYIIQLLDEAEQNLKKLNQFKNIAIKTRKNLDTLSQLLEKKEYNNPKVLTKTQVLLNPIPYDLTIITHENLKFSGDLKLFDDLKLRNSISEPYQFFSMMRTFELKDKELISMHIEDYLMKNLNLKDITNSNREFTKDVYFSNMVRQRQVSLQTNITIYKIAIELFNDLKITLSEFQSNN